MRFSQFTFIAVLLVFSFNNCQKKQNKTTVSKLIFDDSGTKNWKNKWTLDGTKAKVINSNLGMELIAGKEHGKDSCHTVLWTKKIFKGNFKLTYEYTRTDTVTRCVNILYLLASGKGTKEYPEDISKWEIKRKEPKMATYFNNMNAYHISYAAFDANIFSKDNDYIRMRKYNPTEKGLKNTALKPDYSKTGLFKPFVTYHIEVIKNNSYIKMNIVATKNPENKITCLWDISKLENLVSGRIGFRHMYTRNARYKNIKVWKTD